MNYLKEMKDARNALDGLLKDSQHAHHNCGSEKCPVLKARRALSRMDEVIAETEKVSQEPIDKGPWHAREMSVGKKWCVLSDTFKHDVMLIIDGNFEDEADKQKYAEGLAAQLNTVNKEWTDEDVESWKKDSERFEWYMGPTPKAGFINTVLLGAREGWSLDEWRSAIDEARKPDPSQND